MVATYDGPTQVNRPLVARDRYFRSAAPERSQTPPAPAPPDRPAITRFKSVLNPGGRARDPSHPYQRPLPPRSSSQPAPPVRTAGAQPSRATSPPPHRANPAPRVRRTTASQPLTRPNPPSSHSAPHGTLPYAATPPPHAQPAPTNVMKDEPLPSLPRTNPDVPALRERCRKLEKALRETQELVRARDKEVDRLRRELEWTRKESQENLHLAQQAQAAQQQQQRQQRLRRQQSMDAATWHRRQRADRMSDSEDTDTDDEDNPLPPPPMPVSIHSVPLPNTVEQRARTLGLEAFLNKHDSWSGAEVVQAVQDLNAEVLQYAAAAAEACASEALLAHKSNSSRPPASKVAQAIQDTAGRLGAPFVRVLATREHAHDPILVQFAVQACVSTAIQRFWLAFCPGLSAKYDALLAQLYMHMHLSEPQPTSSRWRSLTHKHIRTVFAGLEDHAVSELTETILRWSADVFAISGSHAPRSGAPPSAAVGALRTRFGAQLRRVAQATCRLVQVAREEIMSTSFEVIMLEPGRLFDLGEMSDAFADSHHALAKSVAAAAAAAAAGAQTGQQVLCTTEIGLLCSTRKGGNASPKDGMPVIQRVVLLKPKVVLESVTRALEPS